MNARPLYILSIIFIASFLGRIAVMASEIEGDSASANLVMGAKKSSSSDEPCLTGELADSLATRLERLSEEEKSLAERKAELAQYEAQIEQSLAQLKQANAVFDASIEESRKEHAARIAKVSAIYEGMKASEASEIIEQMDPGFAAGLLASIDSEKAAQIFSAMNPQKAYLVSVLIANDSEAAE